MKHRYATSFGLWALAMLALALPAWADGDQPDTLPTLVTDQSPANFDQTWTGFDPRAEPLEARVVREWKSDGVVMRYVVYRIGTFKGKKARMAGFYGFPEGGNNLPALLHMHGGGQRAFQAEVKRFAKRGYAVLSVNWGGRPMEDAQPDDPNTDWGAVDPTQNNVQGYSNLLPGPDTIDPVPSARNNNWFLLTVGCRRGITFLQQQPEVDRKRIGVYGHSMGGRLTGLVAGTDDRVVAASPSVGGSGFLQHDLWGLPGSARRVRGDVALFNQTIAGEAYMARVRCPILFLSATNDFNAPMDFVARGMKLVPQGDKRMVFAPHLNHRFTEETEIARPLWFDAHLQGRLAFPASPDGELILKRESSVPLFRVKPDHSRPIVGVDIYYGYERDPRNRFWADARAVESDGVWQAECPVFDMDEPLFVFANVRYKLEHNERREGDPDTFCLSTYEAAYPDALRAAGVKATESTRRQIDDFSRGMHDWYMLNPTNREHWFFSTRKLTDPRWEAPRGATLAFAINTTAPNNILAVQIVTDSWRNYTGRKNETYTATVRLDQAGRNRVSLDCRSFTTAEGKPLKDWFAITELIVRTADKSGHPSAKGLAPWQGDIPQLHNLRWEGGDPIRRPKPYTRLAEPIGATGGLGSAEFQKAIDDSVRQEQLDAEKIP